MYFHSRHLALLVVFYVHLYFLFHSLVSRLAVSQAHPEKNPFCGILWLSKALRDRDSTLTNCLIFRTLLEELGIGKCGERTSALGDGIAACS